MKLGFIGTGNMGGALAVAAAKTDAQIFLCILTKVYIICILKLKVR